MGRHGRGADLQRTRSQSDHQTGLHLRAPGTRKLHLECQHLPRRDLRNTCEGRSHIQVQRQQIPNENGHQDHHDPRPRQTKHEGPKERRARFHNAIEGHLQKKEAQLSRHHARSDVNELWKTWATIFEEGIIDGSGVEKDGDKPQRVRG